MAAIAPDTAGVRGTGLARLLRRDVGAGHRRADRGPRAGHRSAHRDRPRVHAGRRRARRRGRRGRPAGLGRHELPGTGPRSCAAPPRSTSANRDEFGEWTQRETGASHSKMHHESNFAYQEILNAATLPSQAVRLAACRPPSRAGSSMVRRVPVGVVGAITPWNSPSVLGMRVVAPALALGNAVVLKPDPQTPSSAARCSPRSSRRRACPRACSRSSSAGPMSARPW